MCYESDAIVNMIGENLAIFVLQKGHPKRYDRRCGKQMLSRMARKAQDSSQGCDLPTGFFSKRNMS